MSWLDEHKRRDAAVKAATTISLSSPVSKTTSASRSHRSDIATLSRGRIETQLPVSDTRYSSTSPSLSSRQFQPEIAAEIRFDSALPRRAAPADIDSDPCPLRFGVKHGARLCFGGGDALAATNSRTII